MPNNPGIKKAKSIYIRHEIYDFIQKDAGIQGCSEAHVIEKIVEYYYAKRGKGNRGSGAKNTHHEGGAECGR